MKLYIVWYAGKDAREIFAAYLRAKSAKAAIKKLHVPLRRVVDIKVWEPAARAYINDGSIFAMRRRRKINFTDWFCKKHAARRKSSKRGCRGRSPQPPAAQAIGELPRAAASYRERSRAVREGSGADSATTEGIRPT